MLLGRVGFICACLATASLVALTAPAAASTIAETVATAVTTHPTIDAGYAARKAAKNFASEQRAGFFPTIAVNGRGGRVNADDDTTRANTGADAYSWLGEGSVTLTQPIFAGFSTIQRTGAARERFLSADRQLNSTAEEVALKAARAHLNMMRTRELLELASRYLDDIAKRRENIRLMLSEGAADEAELLQADEIHMAAKSTRLGYEEAFRQAEADFIEATGMAPTDVLEFGEAHWDAMLPTSIEQAIATAVGNNPRLAGAGNMVNALRREANAEKGTLLPRLDAEISYLEKDQDDDLGGELSNAQAMMKMSWNFSTGGAQLARISRARAQEMEAVSKRADILRTLEHDVRQKFTSVEVVDKQFELYAGRESASESVLQNYYEQFEGGKQSNLQLISAASRLFDARTARTDAFYRRLLARFELLNVMGTLRGAFGIEITPAVKDKNKTASGDLERQRTAGEE